MPLFRNQFENQNRIIANIIPLMMRKKQDEKELSLKQQRLDLLKQGLDQEAQERADKWKQELNKTKIKTLVDLVKGAEKSGDERGMQTLAPQLENLIPGLSLPKEQTPAPSIYGSEGSGQTLNNLVEQGKDIRYLVNPQKSELTGEAKNLEAILNRKPTLEELKDFKGGSQGKDKATVYKGDKAKVVYFDKGTDYIPKNGWSLKKPKDTENDKKTEKNKHLESLKSDYMQQVGRYYSAKRGVGQFVPDENKEAVAQEAHTSAMTIAKQYVDAGGKWEDLGLKEPGKESQGQEMADMPSASDHSGKVIRDTQTGKRFKSDGKNWIEIK